MMFACWAELQLCRTDPGGHVAAAPEHPTRTSAPPRRLTSDARAACSGRPREPGQPFAVASKPRIPTPGFSRGGHDGQPTPSAATMLAGLKGANLSKQTERIDHTPALDATAVAESQDGEAGNGDGTSGRRNALKRATVSPGDSKAASHPATGDDRVVKDQLRGRKRFPPSFIEASNIRDSRLQVGVAV